MVATELYPSKRFIWQCFTPSGASGVLSIFVAIATVVVGVLQAASEQGITLAGNSAQVGTSAPASGNAGHAIILVSWCVLLSAVVWVLVLAVIGATLEFLLGRYSAHQKMHKEVMGGAGTSERRWLIERARFRLIVGLVAIFVAAILLHFVHWASTVEKAPIDLVQFGLGTVAWHTALALIIWTITYYAAVVFIRLFTLRTRVFARKSSF